MQLVPQFEVQNISDVFTLDCVSNTQTKLHNWPISLETHSVMAASAQCDNWTIQDPADHDDPDFPNLT
jgi:hypothetical protein